MDTRPPASTLYIPSATLRIPKQAQVNHVNRERTWNLNGFNTLKRTKKTLILHHDSILNVLSVQCNRHFSDSNIPHTPKLLQPSPLISVCDVFCAF